MFKFYNEVITNIKQLYCKVSYYLIVLCGTGEGSKKMFCGDFSVMHVKY
jgi:hypothetical protein